MAGERFATVINCLDGWVQDPVLAWVKARAGVRFVDVVTTYAPEQVLTAGPEAERRRIHTAIQHSVRTHDLRLLTLAGHAACGGDPVEKFEQIVRIQRALETLASWQFGLQLIGLWVDDHGQVEQVAGGTSAS